MYMYSCVHRAHDNQNIDGGATEVDGGSSVPVGPSKATPLFQCSFINNKASRL